MLFKSQKPAGGGIFKSLNPLKAFTLAEVLITLVVIGIVAALTISILVSKNEKKQLYVQFINTYSTISNALNLAKIDHGDPSLWLSSEQGNPNYIKTYLFPYLKNADDSKSISDYFVSDYKDLNGNSMNWLVEYAISKNPYIVQLPGGAFVFEINGAIVFDTNGQKGPNIFGRDMILVDLADSNCQREGSPFCSKYTPEDCTKLGGAEGDACAVKLLTDGAMKY